MAVAPALLIRKGRAAGAGLLMLAVAVTLAANTTVAHDLSRSASTVIPGAVLGIVLLRAGAAVAGGVGDRGGPGVQSADPGPARHGGVGRNRPGSTPCTSSSAASNTHRRQWPNCTSFARPSSRGRASWPAPSRRSTPRSKIDPTLINAQINRGIVLNNMGRPAAAAACFDAAVRLAPALPETHRRRRLLPSHLRPAARQPRKISAPRSTSCRPGRPTAWHWNASWPKSACP